MQIEDETPMNSTDDAAADKKEAALSDNISLFQSLRVLQEGEEGDERSVGDFKSKTCFVPIDQN